MIAQMAGTRPRRVLANLLNFIAFISINLAIVNFLPIPVLDGGTFCFFHRSGNGSPVEHPDA